MHAVTYIYIHNTCVYRAAQAVTSTGNSSCPQSPQASFALLPRPFHLFHLETTRDHKERPKEGSRMLGCSEWHSSTLYLATGWFSVDFLILYRRGLFTRIWALFFIYLWNSIAIHTYIFVIIYIFNILAILLFSLHKLGIEFCNVP